MKITGFIESTLIDYPGKISYIVFLQGCNLRCDYCHSPKLTGRGHLFQKNYKQEDIINFIKEKNKHQKWIDGIVICGGEPTINKDLPDFLEKIRNELKGVSIKLDTNGTNPQMLEEIIRRNLVDYIAMDVKPWLLVDSEKLYKASIKIVKKFKNYEFRLTCAPPLVAEDHLEWILTPFKGAKRFVFQNFNNKNDMINDYLKKIKPYSTNKLNKWKKKYNGWFNEVIVR